MKKIFATALLTFLAAPAEAQQQPSKFVPYTIDQNSHKQIFDYLNEQPTKFSLPLMQALSGLAQKAIDEEEKKNKENKK